MKKKGIIFKLFFTTISIILIFLSIQWIFQYFWFEDFYEYSKKKGLEQRISTLKNNIEENLLDNAKMDEILTLFSKEENVSIGIMNVYGIPQYGLYDKGKASHIIIKDDDGQQYIVYVENFLNDPDFRDTIYNGKNIRVYGQFIQGKDKEIYPSQLKVENINFISKSKLLQPIQIHRSIILSESEQLPLQEMPNERTEEFVELEKIEIPSKQAETFFTPLMIEVEGSIEDINLKEAKDYAMEYRKNQLMDEVVVFLEHNEYDTSKLFHENKLIQYSKIDTVTGIRNIVFIQPVLVNNVEPMFIFTLASLQPIDEATGILKIYFFIIATILVIISVIVSYLYSRLITKPLLQINEITKKMASLDFTSKCRINSQDEIGDLAGNINILSTKLQQTLGDLTEANEKLAEDIKVKEKEEEFRKSFIANISHELKTPLTIIRGICEGLIKGVYNKNNDDHLNQVLQEINDMNQLIYDLLQTSKMETGVEELKNDIFQLSDVVLKVHNQLKPLIKEKDLSVTLELSEQFVIGDEKNIEIVIKNLYSNSMKYSPARADIIIRMDESEDKCRLTIENTGIKLPESDLSRIWEPFQRVEKSRNKDLGGSGLGLYIVKQILDKHHSQYDIENTEHGVKAYFTLPIIKDI